MVQSQARKLRMKWHKFSEEVPDDYVEVLIYINDHGHRNMYIGYYAGDTWFDNHAEFVTNSKNIKLWAELPWPSDK